MSSTRHRWPPRLRSGFTNRGWAFLSAGLTMLGAGAILDQRLLVRVGLLAVLLPLILRAILGRRPAQLTLARTVVPATVPVGTSARISLRISNPGRATHGTLLLEDEVPYVLGSRPRFTLGRLGHDGRSLLHYVVASEARGRYEVGPLTVRSSDPFGLIEFGAAFRGTATLTVTPQVEPLSRLPLSGAWTGSGDNRPRAFAGGSAEDVTVREYRQGDDLRRVHWRSSARTGQLMVRREEQPWQARATILLDNRQLAHQGSGLGSTFEISVRAAASVASHLNALGYLVRLVTAEGESSGALWHVHDEQVSRRALLDSLAVVSLTGRPGLATGWLGEGSAPGVVVGIFGRVLPQDRGALRRFAAYAPGAAFALALQVDAWGGAVGHPTGAQQLSASGWRGADITPTQPLAAAWAQLGQAPRLATQGLQP